MANISLRGLLRGIANLLYAHLAESSTIRLYMIKLLRSLLKIPMLILLKEQYRAAVVEATKVLKGR